MTANANIIINTAQDTLAVPSSAVKTQNGQSFVQVFTPPLQDTGGTTGVTTTQTPQNIPVTTGISDDTNIQILSGLSLGQQYIVRTTSGTATARTTTGTSATGGRTNGGFGGGGAVLRGL
jgi:HlyD family secretion protein